MAREAKGDLTKNCAPPHLGNKLDDFFFRLKRNHSESMAEWALRSNEVYQRLLSALSQATGQRHAQICESSTQIVAHEMEFEVVDYDLDDASNYSAVPSRHSTASGRSASHAATHGSAWRSQPTAYGQLNIPPDPSKV